jgi:hypothetical protein
MILRSRSLCRAWCFVIILQAVAKCLSFAGDPHPSLPPPIIPECLGVNIHFTDPQPGEMEMLAAAGFKWVRMDFTWAGSEREKGVYDFSAYERLAAHLDKHKLRALFILDYGNKLYDPDGSAPHTDESRAAFARWAAAAVAHFKGKGYVWELWNEPNIAQFWKPKPNVDDYVALAKATASALREAGLILGRNGSPSRPPDASAANEPSKNQPATDDSASDLYRGECFIGPATSTIDMPFLEACFKAGLLDVWDAISLHPYRQSAPETVEEEYRSVRLLIRKYAPKNKAIPIVSGEWGYSSAWKDFDEEKQAKYLPRQFLTNIANDVALSIWYDWRDDGPDPKEPEHHFGLVRHEYREGKDPVFEPKPAYQAAETIMKQLAGMRFNKRLAREVNAPEHMLLFQREREIKVAIWQHRFPNPYGFYEFRPNQSFTVLNFLGDAVDFPTGKQEGRNIFGDSPYFVGPADAEGKRAWKLAAGWKRLPLEFPATVPSKLKFKSLLPNPESKPLFYNLDTELLIPGYRYCVSGSEGSKPARTSRRTIEDDLTIQVASLQSGQRVVQHLAAWSSNGKELTGLFSQSSTIAVLNPIEIEMLPPDPDGLVISILNPSGEAFGGGLGIELNLSNGAGVYAGQSIELKPFEYSRILKVPFESMHGGGDPPTRAPANFEGWSSLSGGLAISQNLFALHRNFGVPRLIENFNASHLVVDSSHQGTDTRGSQRLIDTAEFSPPSGGPASIHYFYSLGNGWCGVRFEPTIHVEVAAYQDRYFTQLPSRFGLWLHGDGKGCQARIRFTDSTGQTFQSDGPKIDWTDWRYITFPMQSTEEKPLAHWGGANDGVIHYPIKWDTIFLLDNVSRQPVEGEVYLSAPTLIY